MNGKDLLTTQLYVKGHSQNEGDGLYKRLRDEKTRDSVTADFSPAAESKELAAKWDIVLGTTPADTDPHHRVRSSDALSPRHCRSSPRPQFRPREPA